MSRVSEIFLKPVCAPLQKLQLRFFEQAGLDAYIKREDMIHPFISGNKWRKLKYNLLEAEKLGKPSLLTFGGAWSNHLLATACAAALFGFKSKGIVRNDEAASNPMLKLCELFGMQLVYSSREAYRDKEHLAHTYMNDESYLIPEGGSNELAVKGCAEIAGDLDRAFDHILLACGTGGTIAGLSQGIAAKFPQSRIHGIVVLKGGDGLKEDIQSMAGTTENWQLHLNDHEGGYAKTSQELLDLIKTTAAGTGILFDQVYTGKMLKAAKRMAGEGTFRKGESLLLIHTGGMMGYLSQLTSPGPSPISR
jgi:1-aminocyclopropane-1-carboxylate deaminase